MAAKPAVKMTRQGDGFFSNEQITVDKPEDIEKFKAQGYQLEEAPGTYDLGTTPSPVAPTTSTLPSQPENPLGLVGTPTPTPPPPPAAAAAQQTAPAPSIPALGAMVKTSESTQTTGYSLADEQKIKTAQAKADESRKKQFESQQAMDNLLKQHQVTNAQAADEAASEMDTLRKTMTDDELAAQTQFLTEYKAALDKFNAQPPPQTKGWWEISSTGEKVAAGVATVMAALLHSRTGDMSAVKTIVDNMDERVKDDLDAQKARYLAERDKLTQRKELNDLRAKSFRDSIAAIDVKRNIMLEEVKRKGELAIMQDKTLDDAQKAAKKAEFDALVAEKQVQNMKDMAKKVTSQSTYSMTQPKGPMDEKDVEDILSKKAERLGLKTANSPYAIHAQNKQALEQLRKIDNPKATPAERQQAAVQMARFIAKGMEQGSFTPSMEDVTFPSNLLSDVEKVKNYVLADPAGKVSTAQIKAMRNYMEAIVSSPYAKGLDERLNEEKKILQGMGINPNRLEAAVGWEPSTTKPVGQK